MFGHRNGGEISPGDYRRSNSCDSIGMDIFATRDERHGISVHGSGEASSGNLFASSFLRKIEISPTHCRNLKYNSGQESRPRPIVRGSALPI